MIIDIPTSKDFQEEGISSLNLAWELVVSLISEYDSIESAFPEAGDDLDKVYWAAAKKSLTTSISMAQHGMEFLLKGKVAEISPFLLIAGTPSEWPRACHSRDTSFSEFKTIDAQELIRVHDTVSGSRLSDDFKQRFESMRSQRNTIMHTVSKSLLPTAKEVVIATLEIVHSLVRPQSWVKIRDEYLETSPTYIVDSVLPEIGGDSEIYRVKQLAEEMFRVIDFLEPALVRKHFGINKKQRRYACPTCLSIMAQDSFFEFNPDEPSQFSAALRPNKPDSKTIYCLLCDTAYKVKRQDCSDPDEAECKGNVIDEDSNYCLTCWEVNE